MVRYLIQETSSNEIKKETYKGKIATINLSGRCYICLGKGLIKNTGTDNYVPSVNQPVSHCYCPQDGKIKLSLDANLSSFSLAESSPLDLQITDYK